MKRQFAATVWCEGEWYISQCLAGDVTSQGETEDEVLANLKEAQEFTSSLRKQHGHPPCV